ncbi:MAG: peptide chain release factor-like protein [Gemmatimonadota bacterium]
MPAPERPTPPPRDDEALLKECRVETFRSGGPGGQHQNTTESGVRLVHLPTGVRASSREHRSQHRNRALALRRLRAKLEERLRVQKPRKATKPSAAAKRKRRRAKERRSEQKRLRRKPRTDD